MCGSSGLSKWRHRGVSLDTPGPPLAEKAQTQRLLEMPCDYSRGVDFETPTESFMKQIPDFPNFLTLTCDLQVMRELGDWVLD